MSLLAEIVVAALIVLGAGFALVGSWGLVRLPDLISRLHAPTKATTLGVGSVLLASMIHDFALGDGVSIHELLIVLFLFLTAPLSANVLAMAYLHRHVDAEALPQAGESVWSTFASDATERPSPEGAPPPDSDPV